MPNQFSALDSTGTPVVLESLPTVGQKSVANSLPMCPPSDIETYRIGRLSNFIFYADTATPLAGAATFTGSARDVGWATSTPVPFGYFNAFCITDQSGTLRTQGSDDGSTWYITNSVAVVASTPVWLKTPVAFRFNRVMLVNGATLQTTVKVNSSYGIA